MRDNIFTTTLRLPPVVFVDDVLPGATVLPEQGQANQSKDKKNADKNDNHESNFIRGSLVVTSPKISYLNIRSKTQVVWIGPGQMHFTVSYDRFLLRDMDREISSFLNLRAGQRGRFFFALG